MKHFVSLDDYDSEQILAILDEAFSLKQLRGEGRLSPVLAGRTLALVFEKSSMRTRVSFEVAMAELGGSSIYLSQFDVNLGERESVKDGALVLSRYVDCIAARTYAHSTVEELARHSRVPVINALSDLRHPCQALADVMTVKERFGCLKGIQFSFIGDGNNVARSLAVVCARLGMSFSIATPEGYELDEDTLQSAASCAEKTGAEIHQCVEPQLAAEGADVIYTDTWISMGQEEEASKRIEDFKGYCVDEELLKLAKPTAIVMHCLPAHRGKEITDAVMDGPQSAVFDQAENRLHAQRGLLRLLLTEWE